MGARYYDATFGRFITRDTELGQAPYAYCNGDPVNFSDPSGHGPYGDGFAVLGTAFGVVLAVALIVLFSPEIGGIACIGAALAYSGPTTYFVGALTPIVTGYIGLEVGNDYDEHHGDPIDRPKKSGGGPAAGDSTTTGGEAGGNGAVQGATSAPNPTTYDDYAPNGTQIGGPYVGPPHYGPKP